ncbi:MAG: hypothetical protein U0746_21930 [Gemmataceae bacterium]
MLTAWWKKKATAVAERDVEPVEQPIRVGRSAVPDDAEAGYDREQWAFPFDDLSWTGSEERPAPPPAFFAFDDAGAPDTEPWRADGWWVRACPLPKLPPPTVAEAGPGAWGLTAEYAPREVKPKKPRPVLRPMPTPVLRGIDRIEKLREFFVE